MFTENRLFHLMKRTIPREAHHKEANGVDVGRALAVVALPRVG